MATGIVIQGNPAIAESSDDRGWFGHPRGLTNLFFTELWERFSYYGMRAILVLYMVAAPSVGGLGFDVRMATTIYGLYTMSVYMFSIPGGIIADRWLGARISILTGGLIIALGHFTLALHAIEAFYGGLLLIVLGTGLLKPNISTLLGRLYARDAERRDAGFSIFYMGINIGAALAPLVCGFLAQSELFRGWLRSAGIDPNLSWHFGFAAAGVGMLIGLAHYVLQYQRIAHVGGPPARLNLSLPRRRSASEDRAVSLVEGQSGTATSKVSDRLVSEREAGNPMVSPAEATQRAGAPQRSQHQLASAGETTERAGAPQKSQHQLASAGETTERTGAPQKSQHQLASSGETTERAGAPQRSQHQLASSGENEELTAGRDKVQDTIAASVEGGEPTAPIGEKIDPPLTRQEWRRLGAIGFLFVFTMLFWAIYEQGGSSLNLFADRLTRNEIFGWEYPSSWLQSLSAFYCILLAPTFAWLWIKLGAKQPSSPAKFALGLFFLAAGISLMVPASLLAAGGAVSPMWLVMAYLLAVVGEMCLSPVGLSTVTKLAPERFQSSTMGVWFLAAGLGNFLAGYLAGFFDDNSTGALVTLFGFMGIALLAAAVVCWTLSPLIRKLMSGIR